MACIAIFIKFLKETLIDNYVPLVDILRGAELSNDITNFGHLTSKFVLSVCSSYFYGQKFNS